MEPIDHPRMTFETLAIHLGGRDSFWRDAHVGNWRLDIGLHRHGTTIKFVITYNELDVNQSNNTKGAPINVNC